MKKIKFKVLDSCKDSFEWDEIITNNLKIQEIFFRSDYLNLFITNNKITNQTVGNLFVAFNDLGFFWINCFLKKKINNYENITQNEYFEIETPYGYGGPYSNTYNENFISESQNIYFEWCKKNKVVVEFVRFNPILDNRVFFNKIDQIYLERKNRYFDLQKLDSELTHFSSKVRNKIKQTKKVNVELDFKLNKINFNLFKIEYIEFIKSIKGNNFYLFNNSYFKNLYDLIDKFGFLVTARLNNKFLGGSIFIGFENIINYYLTVIPDKKILPGINNLILINSYFFSKKKGFQLCNLGGGISSQEDSLYDFKKSMSNIEKSFFIGRKIHNSFIYHKLIKAYRSRYPEASKKNLNKILCYNFYDD